MFHFCDCVSHAGVGIVQFVDPPRGSTIAGFEGAMNITTITCNISSSHGTQISTQWFIANFRGESFDVINDMLAPELFLFSGDPIPNVANEQFSNRLTVLTLNPDLDQVTIYCGSGTNQQQTNIIVRIYR